MSYYVEKGTLGELRDMYPQIAEESMRCGPPESSLYPPSDILYVAVEHDWAFVAKDVDTASIVGAALIKPDGEVAWLTLPSSNSLEVMEALLDFFWKTRGVNPWGDVTTESLRSLVLMHEHMHHIEGTRIQWR